jgi:4-hydroxy-3-methylbut-2-enyl diphosphate reductase
MAHALRWVLVARAPTWQRRSVRAEREILVASPRGFCAGVSYAIDIVDLVLERHGPPVYVRHEIVHNRHVVEGLRARGAVFVDELAAVPAGSVVIFSAHGVAPSVREEAKRRDLRVIDATCPLVTKVHVEALRYARDGYEILVVGHRGHVEVIGTLGHAPDQMQLVESVDDVARVHVRDPERVAVVTQTTLSVDDTRDIVEAIRRHLPKVRLPAKDDICYATQNRQMAVKELARQSDLVLVLGSPTSSNASRLVEVARNVGTATRLIEHAAAIDPTWLDGVRAVGLTAGASTPEVLVQDAIASLRSRGFDRVRDVTTAEEHITFPLPRELRAPGEGRSASTRDA